MRNAYLKKYIKVYNKLSLKNSFVVTKSWQIKVNDQRFFLCYNITKKKITWFNLKMVIFYILFFTANVFWNIDKIVSYVLMVCNAVYIYTANFFEEFCNIFLLTAPTYLLNYAFKSTPTREFVCILKSSNPWLCDTSQLNVWVNLEFQ